MLFRQSQLHLPENAFKTPSQAWLFMTLTVLDNTLKVSKTALTSPVSRDLQYKSLHLSTSSFLHGNTENLSDV